MNETTYKPATAAEALALPPGTEVVLQGWVERRSQVGGLLFAILRDGTGYMQLSAKKGAVAEQVFEGLKSATKESAIRAKGEVRADRRAPGGAELSVREFELVAPAETWPITATAARARAFLSDNRHLSIRGPKAVAAMKIRAEVVGAAFDYFREKGFTLISAPTFVGAAVEGGSTLFEVPYFGKKAYLSQSAQFYEEAALPALERVWIFQPAFRAEKSKTPKHLTEFWMIEAEQAFVEQPQNMALQEGLLAKMVERVVERRHAELKTLGRTLAPLELPLPRISYEEAMATAEKKGFGFKWGEDITTEAERAVSMSMDRPFFVTGYPLSARSFYHMTYPDRPDVTRSADLMAPEGYGELATGGQRMHDYNALMERITSQELPPESFTWYLELRKYGMPPHCGFGIGVERCTRWIAGLKHIRSASLFPRTVTRISP